MDMTFYENIESRIQYIDDNMTLKSDYSEELSFLDGIKSDISVGLYSNNFSPAQAAYLKKRISEIKNWIIAERAAGLSCRPSYDGSTSGYRKQKTNEIPNFQCFSINPLTRKEIDFII